MKQEKPTQWTPKHFIDEEISPSFLHPLKLTKKPDVPDGFVWHAESFRITDMLAAWYDTTRRGRMARNMSRTHLEHAARRGSWGVGRWYFRVQTTCGRVFDLYYDRAPKDASDRKGHWVLWREMQPG